MLVGKREIFDDAELQNRKSKQVKNNGADGEKTERSCKITTVRNAN